MITRGQLYLLASGARSPSPYSSTVIDSRALSVDAPPEAEFEIILDALGRIWNSLLHPRDRWGRFIRTFSRVSWDPKTGWGRGNGVRRRNQGSAWDGDALAFGDGGNSVIVKVVNAEPGANIDGHPVKPGDIVKVRRQDLRVNTVKARLGSKGVRQETAASRRASGRAESLARDLGYTDLADRAAAVQQRVEARGGAVDADIDEWRAIGEELQDRFAGELSGAGVPVSLETQPKDIEDADLKGRATMVENALANINKVKHEYGDREYAAERREGNVKGSMASVRRQMARSELKNAADSNAEMLDLSKGPGRVQMSRVEPFQGDPGGSKGTLRTDADRVLPELRPGVAQEISQGERRVSGLGQANQEAAPADRFLINADGEIMGVGDFAHFNGGTGRGGGRREPVTGMITRIWTDLKADPGEDGMGNIRMEMEYIDESGVIQKMRPRPDNVSAPTVSQQNRFLQLSEGVAGTPAAQKGSSAFQKMLQEAGSQFALPLSKRRSRFLSQEDRRSIDINGEALHRGDWVQSPDGSLGRIESISADGERVRLMMPHKQAYPQLNGARLTKIHDNNHDVVAGERLHNGGGFLPTRQEAVQAMERLGIGPGPARTAVADPNADWQAIQAAMRSDPEFMAAVQDATDLWERRNRAMATGGRLSPEDAEKLQDWDAVVSASGEYFRQGAPTPPQTPASAPEAQEGDPPNPQDPSSPTKAITPNGESVSRQEGEAPEAEEPEDDGIDRAVGTAAAQNVLRAIQDTQRIPGKNGILRPEAAAVRQAMEDRDGAALIASVEALGAKMGNKPIYANTPILRMVRGDFTGGVPLADWLRRKDADRPLFDQPPRAKAVEKRPATTADVERPDSADPDVDSLNTALSESLLAGRAVVLGPDGKQVDTGFAVIPSPSDAVESFEGAPSVDDVRGFLQGRSNAAAVAAWRDEDGNWHLGEVELTPDKERAHEVATGPDGSGQYIDITDGMVYNAVPSVPGDPAPDSSKNDVVDDRSARRSSEPAGEGRARLNAATQKQKDLVDDIRNSGLDIPSDVDPLLQRMIAGEGEFTADEMKALTDWLRTMQPSDVWGDEFTPQQRNGMKAAVVNLAKRLSVDSGAAAPDPYPSESTSKRRTREVAVLAGRAADQVGMAEGPGSDRAQLDLLIASARSATIDNNFAMAASLFRQAAAIYDKYAEDGNYLPRVSARIRSHADRLERSQSLVAAGPRLTQTDLANASRMIDMEPYLPSTAQGREARGLIARISDALDRNDASGAKSAIDELDAFLRDPANKDLLHSTLSRQADEEWSSLIDRLDLGEPLEDIPGGVEGLDARMQRVRAFVDKYSDELGEDSPSLSGAMDWLDEASDQIDRYIRGLDGQDARDAHRESEENRTEELDGIDSDSVSGKSDEELDSDTEDVLTDEESGPWLSDEAATAVQTAAEALKAEQAARQAAADAEKADALSKGLATALENLDTASKNLRELSDAELEDLARRASSLDEQLPDNIDADTEGRIDGIRDAILNEQARRMNAEAYDEEEGEEAPESTEFDRDTWVSPDDLKVKRVGAGGAYEAQVGPGRLDRYEILKNESGWALTYPGQTRADDTYPTLKDARSAIDAHYREMWESGAPGEGEGEGEGETTPEGEGETTPEGEGEGEGETTGEAPTIEVIDPDEVLYPELEELAAAIMKLADEEFEPTLQQKRIIAAVLKGDDVVVRALAGTGKTSTIVAMAKRMREMNPGQRAVYIAFNKSVQLEAEKRMPDNVESRTANSLAWQAMGPEFHSKTEGVSAAGNSMISKPSTLFKHMKLRTVWDETGGKDNMGADLGERGTVMLLRSIVNRFMISADDEISMDHVDAGASVRDVGLSSDEDREFLLEKARDMWEDFKDPNGRIRMDQDALVKMWAMSNPQFTDAGSGVRRTLGADGVIFFDEAQDINPVLAQVVRNNTDLQKVTVGDSNQAIYGFRGATDQLDGMRATYDLPLTQSWRFGKQIADGGNRFLRLHGSKHRVEGGGADGEIYQPGSMQDPDAILVRTNVGAMMSLMQMLERDRTVGVSKKLRDRIASIKASVDWLQDPKGEKPSNYHEDMESFEDWDEFFEAATRKEKPDPAARLIYNVYNSAGDRWDEILDRVKIIKSDADPDGYTEATAATLARAADEQVEVIDGIKVRRTGRNKYALSGNTFANKDAIKSSIGRAVRWNGANKTWDITGTDDQVLKNLRALQAQLGGEVDTVITTAHMAKGLEWDRVRIGDDFWEPKEMKGGSRIGGMTKYHLPEPEELRLYYVAVTRAKKALDPGSLGWVYRISPEQFGVEVPEGDDPLPVEFVVPDDDNWFSPPTVVMPNPFQPGAPEGDSDEEGDLLDSGDVVPGGPGPAAFSAGDAAAAWF